MALVKTRTFSQFSKIVVVTDKSQLAGDLSSGVEYFLDGIIDMGNQSIVIPQGGITFVGYSFDLSGLTSSEDNYTMFTSPVGGSGNFLGKDYLISVTGANSRVYNIASDTGNEAFEFEMVNYNNCTSLGVIDSYRQGLESDTGRFGGTPTLELAGAWTGGYRITTSVVRNISDSMNAPLFKAGTGFVMQSRFLTDINVDLGATASLVDFSPSNFPNPSTIQIIGAIVTRNGVFNANDSTLTPNLLPSDLPCFWKRNIGLDNTYVGGRMTITTETLTVVSSIGAEYDIAGTYTPSLLVHFDSPANGRLRHLGSTQREFSVVVDLVIDGPQNNEVQILIKKWDDSASTLTTAASQRRTVNALAGGRDVAFFTFITPVKLDQNDYIKIMIKNNSSTGDLTAELDSFITITEQ